MYKKIKINFFIAIVTILSSISINSLAQGGSNYSALGFGDFNNFGNANTAGMNGLSIAIPSHTSINLSNPALWSEITMSRLNMGYWFNQNVVSTDDYSLWQNNGSVSGFTGALNMSKKYGITMALGMVPKTAVRYYIGTPILINQDEIYAEGTTYYRGEGGLNDAFIGLSGRFFGRIAFGVSANYTFGTITSYTNSLFKNDVTLYSPKSTTKDFLSGWGGKVGTFIDLGKGFNVGGVFEFGTQLTYDSDLAYFGVNAATDTLIKTNGLKTTIPVSIGAGLSYEYERMTVGLDFIRQNYSDLDYRLGNETEFRNTNQFILGLNINPPKRQRNYIDRISWRAGLAYRNLYYTVHGEDIDELSASLGMGLPAGKTLIFDIGVVLGTRGTTNNSLVNENFGRLFVDFSIGEIWFQRHERDYTIEDE